MPNLTPEQAKEKSDRFDRNVMTAAKTDAAAFRAATERSALAEVERSRMAVLKQAADIADRYEAAIIKIARGASETFTGGLNTALGKAVDADALEEKARRESLAKMSVLKKGARDALNKELPKWLAEAFKCGHYPHQCDFPKPHKDPDDGLDNFADG